MSLNNFASTLGSIADIGVQSQELRQRLRNPLAFRQQDAQEAAQAQRSQQAQQEIDLRQQELQQRQAERAAQRALQQRQQAQAQASRAAQVQALQNPEILGDLERSTGLPSQALSNIINTGGLQALGQIQDLTAQAQRSQQAQQEIDLRQQELQQRQAERAAQRALQQRQQAQAQASRAAQIQALQNPQVLGTLSDRLGVPVDAISQVASSGGLDAVKALGNLTASPSTGQTGALLNQIINADPNDNITNTVEALQVLRGGAGRTGALQANIALGQEANRQQRLGTLGADLQLQPEITRKTEEARLEGSGGVSEREKLERDSDRNKVFSQSALHSAFNSSENINQVIDKALSQADVFTTGVGALLADVPGSPQHDLAANLQTIEADAAFSELQAIRDASPTGGALGGVSEQELNLLGAAKAALNQSQSPEQFRENLIRYKNVRSKALENVARAYKSTYGELPEGIDLADGLSESNQSPVSQMSNEELLSIINGN